jgi:hypothetical protein
MTRAFHALERSLRDGPPDESGYIPGPIEVGRGARPEPALPAVTLERVRPVDIERPPRSRSLAQSFSFILSVAVGVALVVGGLAVFDRLVGSGASDRRSPSPSSSAATGPAFVVAPLSQTFVSPRNGFSVRYPAGWSVKPATKSWPADIFLPLGNPAFDELQRAGEARLVVASQRLGAGQTDADWLASFAHIYQGAAPCGTAPAASPRVTIDGHSGYLVNVGCPLPADSTFSTPDIRFRAIVIADGRVYDVQLDGNVDRSYFDALVATIRLDPASAVDP